MPRPAKSQWDFGELFSPEQTRRVWSVSELTAQVRRLLEQHLGTVWVGGEITNFSQSAAGHCYFGLKDGVAQIQCVLFRGAGVSAAVRAALADGQKVIVQGEVSVYEARGQYQLVVRAVELQGVGALQAAFEQLKRKLAAEGLFAPERKRPVPRFPQRLGLVTSPAGAALRDVLHVIRRRQPGLEIILAPCRVQGEGAAAEIAAALSLLNELHAAPDGVRLDAILVTRGGGSLEDLWAFNEEVVARALAASVVPTVSAVGHEIDFTIADFVADLRAATPSAAAEQLTEGVFSSREFIAAIPARLRQRCADGLAQRSEVLAALTHRLQLAHPRRPLREGAQRLDDALAGLGRGLRARWREASLRMSATAARLVAVQPARQCRERADHVGRLLARLQELTRRGLADRQTQWQRAEERLRLLGPEQVLARGYSLTLDAVSGRIVRDAAQVKPGQPLRTRLAQGEIRSVATES